MISVNILKKRRDILISKMVAKSAILIFATPENIKRQNEYQFRQNKDFWYFTGFNEPNALFIIVKKDDKFTQKILFNKPKDPDNEIWFGSNLGQDSALTKIDVDYALPWNVINENIYRFLIGLNTIYYAWGEYVEADTLVFDALNNIRNDKSHSSIIPSTIIDWRPLVHEMRLFKGPEEIELLRIAGKISALAHTRAMKACHANMFEYQLEGEIHHEFSYHGVKFPSYNTIVGSGNNACILHYTKNKNKMCDGDLVLVDAGCSFKEYASDITRTFPVNGKFNKQQRELYNIVLTALKSALLMLKPGIIIDEVNNVVINIIVNNLVKIGILKGKVDELISEGTYQQFFMHNLSHWLGLDVHDVSRYGKSMKNQILQPNMVLTVEPGLYISPYANVPIEYRGIGIRIEDNILITETGNECFTNGAVKEIELIEDIMKLKKIN
ncbi:Xaa-Pro aminopeptidase [Candidatus Pantoea edessiphila]|uniref:Xaa-Pro aminopeptidase n=1 Tax=Candidatus Pantoea edessiphila TaxID=2044610 RepID=A0A2P5SZQ1_9GAMM|nr:Xaa-Pro aminopeptidase [Candidatus Pantoea edessiphila]PPI87780.1 Xaa-Pro aminopeptidase [Candidatus Pantoea edessiphila]